MDKDRVSGKVKDIKGRIKRQAGEWTGKEDLQAEGTVEQAEGKTQNVVGKVKDAGREMIDNAERKIQDRERDREVQREEERRIRGKKVA